MFQKGDEVIRLEGGGNAPASPKIGELCVVKAAYTDRRIAIEGYSGHFACEFFKKAENTDEIADINFTKMLVSDNKESWFERYVIGKNSGVVIASTLNPLNCDCGTPVLMGWKYVKSLPKTISTREDAQKWAKLNPDIIVSNFVGELQKSAEWTFSGNIEGYSVITGIKPDGTPQFTPLTEIEIKE